jgi:hypothetical protein
MAHAQVIRNIVPEMVLPALSIEQLIVTARHLAGLTHCDRLLALTVASEGTA